MVSTTTELKAPVRGATTADTNRGKSALMRAHRFIAENSGYWTNEFGGRQTGEWSAKEWAEAFRDAFCTMEDVFWGVTGGTGSYHGLDLGWACMDDDDLVAIMHYTIEEDCLTCEEVFACEDVFELCSGCLVRIERGMIA